MHPGLKAAGIDPTLVDQLVEAAKIPVTAAKKRKETVQTEKTEFDKLNGMLTALDSSLNGLKTRVDFYKLKMESSHPDIIDGTVGAAATLGTYELEVRGLARNEKELAYGFPDKDESPVGFGFMLIDREDKEPVELVVEPDTTLQGLAQQINDLNTGVKAMVINTKYTPDSFRLLVVSEESGKEAKITIDEDTTFIEFKEQVTGRNLDVLFEDVPVTDTDNSLEELISDVTLNVKRSEPGTRVQVSIVHDADATFEGIGAFIEAYNKVAGFINGQFQQNKETGGYGLLSGDGSIKMIMRQLQSAIINVPTGARKFGTLAEIGITTNAKTGLMEMKEAKVRQSLAEDYDSVARLFIQAPNSTGVAAVMSDRLRGFRDPASGILKSRIRGLDRIIDNQDQEIERRERQLEQREQSIRRQFTALESNLGTMKNQGDFLKAKLGGGGEGS
jgi:flagellar hook-associated protein 2